MKLHPRLTAQGVVLARRGERLRSRAERDGRGWVVGYGHRASAREGAEVDEADATSLLVYDLSQSAGRVEPLLQQRVTPALFDALNAYAFRIGVEPFARSEILRRVNTGEVVTPAEVAKAQAGAGEGAAPSAVLAAADAVRVRLSQVLTEPEAPPPRAPRDPWREPPLSLLPAEAEAPAVALPPAPDTLLEIEQETVDVGEAGERFASPDAEPDEPPPPPFVTPPAPTPPAAPPEFVVEGAPSSWRVKREAEAETAAPEAPPAVAPSAGAHPAAPVVSFERGGRARLWARVRANPAVYMAVGACGLVLFACAILGFLLGRPTVPGLMLGLVGVLCLAPATAFFLHRRSGRS